MANKEYKTYSQLISILRNRGMTIDKDTQESWVEHILEKENYYNIINGYKDLFLDKANPETERYIAGTTFNELYSLYNFDREVRNIYLKYLLKVENSFKTVLAHEFSSLYGHDNYLRLENFYNEASTDTKVLKKIANINRLNLNNDFDRVEHLSSEENISNIIKLIGDIQQEIARQMSKHHQAVTHYMSEYGYIPLWVLVNVLTFGKITNFYKLMKPSDKINISRIFGVSSDNLHAYMEMCSLARNKCAHDERFFDMKFRRNLHSRSIANFDVLELERDSSGSYPSGINDIYGIAIIFTIILNKNDIQNFIVSMEHAFASLKDQLHTITIEDVMRKMGYHSSWSNLIYLMDK